VIYPISEFITNIFIGIIKHGVLFVNSLRDYYREMGLSEAKIQLLNQELSITNLSGLTEEVHEKRLRSLNEAKTNHWNHGPKMDGASILDEVNNHHMNMSQWQRSLNPVYKIKGYTIGAARPGKEAAHDYNRINHYNHCTCPSCKSGTRVMGVNNPHDMFPYIERNNVLMSVKRRTLKSGAVKITPWTFEHLFSLIEGAYESSEMQLALELLGSIMVRIAFMLDHEEDSKGHIRLRLPEHSTQEMTRRLPNLGTDDWAVPIEAVIFFLDILGFNEDIKVDVCGYRNLTREYTRGVKPQDNGRTNTLLTISHMLAAVLHRRPIGEFAYGLHRGMGMNAMSKGTINSAYPLLSPNIADLLDKEITSLGWSPR